MSTVYDVAIIGSGPAGLSAAITLKIRNKQVLLLGHKELSEKVMKAHEVKNYLGLPDAKGSDLFEHFTNHLQKMDLTITEDDVTTIMPMGNAFSLLGKSNQMYQAKSLILATGVVFGKPYPGEKEYLGKGVSYCATCDAMFYRGKTVAIIGSSSIEEAEANFMADVASKVYYIPLYQETKDLHESIEIVKDVPVAIEGEDMVSTLRLKKSSLTIDGVFILRDAVSPDQLLKDLELDGKHIRVDRKLRTNIPGVFAAGDVTGEPYQYIKSAGEGNVAALSCVTYLQTLS